MAVGALLHQMRKSTTYPVISLNLYLLYHCWIGHWHFLANVLLPMVLYKSWMINQVCWTWSQVNQSYGTCKTAYISVTTCKLVIYMIEFCTRKHIVEMSEWTCILVRQNQAYLLLGINGLGMHVHPQPIYTYHYASESDKNWQSMHYIALQWHCFNFTLYYMAVLISLWIYSVCISKLLVGWWICKALFASETESGMKHLAWRDISYDTSFSILQLPLVMFNPTLFFPLG